MLHDLQTRLMLGIYDKKYANVAFPSIDESGNHTAERQLSIYRTSIFGGLKKALAETFPVTKQLVGDDFFNAMTGQYIARFPCQVQDLNDYGELLSEFIRDLKQARSVPYLADMAKLEWSINLAYHSKLQQANLDKLSGLSEQQQLTITLHLANGSSLLHLNYPVDEIWNKHQNNTQLEITLQQTSLYLIVFKNDYDVVINRISKEQFYFLTCCNNGLSFVEVCEAMLNTCSEATLNTIFSESIQYGWLQNYTD